MTKTMVEGALEEETAEHLGRDKHAEGRNRASSRNGNRSKTGCG